MKNSLIPSIAVAVCSMAAIFTAHAQQPFSEKPFTDVPKSSPRYEAIEYLRQNNVLRGYLDGTFRPDTRISRAEFVTLVTNPFFLAAQRDSDCLRAHYGSGTTAVFYRDVRAQDWFAQDVCFATVNEIVHGYPDGSFQPNHSINFVEAAKVAADVLAIKVQNESSGDLWYTPYVRRLAELHAIPTTIHRMSQTLTRGEMAEIVFRLKTGNTGKASMTFQGLGK